MFAIRTRTAEDRLPHIEAGKADGATVRAMEPKELVVVNIVGTARHRDVWRESCSGKLGAPLLCHLLKSMPKPPGRRAEKGRVRWFHVVRAAEVAKPAQTRFASMYARQAQRSAARRGWPQSHGKPDLQCEHPRGTQAPGFAATLIGR